jgi:MEMO1 family protein
MKGVGRVFLGLVVLVALGGLWFWRALQPLVSTQPSYGVQPLVFFEKDHFYEGVAYAKRENKTFPYHVGGGIVPHHLLPGFIISDFFQRLGSQQPEVVILIGPNHYEKGEANVLTSTFDWQTPFGVVNHDEDIINSLVGKGLVKVDNVMAENEHSVAGMMPYVNYYLPKARVVPLMLKRHTTLEEINLLAGELQGLAEQDAVIVASVDFSHYLRSQEAQVKDEVTMKVLADFDYRHLLTLNNDYMDSPASLALLLTTMQKLGADTRELLHHTNSGILQGDPLQPTTSYISIAFH